MSHVAIVPARWGSSRFEGKPIVELGGVPMIVRTAKQSLAAEKVDRVVVATDDRRIVDVCAAFDIETVMTGDDHPTGTDRVAEASRLLETDRIVNVQGDEPLIEPETIDAVIRGLNEDPEAIVSNAACPLPVNETDNPNVAKAIADRTGRLLYVSRLPLPYAWGSDVPRLRHLGLYAFGPGALELYASRDLGALEQSERIEMFRFVEYGDRIVLVEVPPGPPSVDRPDDVDKIEAYAAEHGGWPTV